MGGQALEASSGGEELTRSPQKLGKGLGAKGQLGQRPRVSYNSVLVQEAVCSMCVYVCVHVLGTNGGKRGDCEIGEVFEESGDKSETMSRKMKFIL